MRNATVLTPVDVLELRELERNLEWNIAKASGYERAVLERMLVLVQEQLAVAGRGPAASLDQFQHAGPQIQTGYPVKVF